MIENPDLSDLNQDFQYVCQKFGRSVFAPQSVVCSKDWQTIRPGHRSAKAVQMILQG